MIKLLILFLLPLLLLANPPVKESQSVTLQLNWKFQFEFAGYIAAYEKGFYRQVGLDVNITEYNTDTDVIQSVLSGDADFAIYDDDITFLADQKKPIIWLQNYLKRPALALVVKPNIFTPKDLVGKRIMATKDELSTSAVGLMLKKFAIDEKSFTRIKETYTIDPFVNGDVDAMTVYLSNELYALDEAKVNYNLLDPTAYNIHSLGGNLFTSKEMLKRSEDVVQQFMHATIRGWVYALENKDELINIIYERYSQKKPIAALEYEADVIERLIMPSFYPIGSIESDRVYKNATFLMQSGLISSVQDLNNYIYQSNISTILSQEEEDYLVKKKQIKMCIDPNWMPFEKIENGEHIGMTADYFKLLSKSIGTPITLVPSQNWSESIELAKNRKCDIFSLAMETPKRKEYMDFTSPYIRMPLVVATKSDKLFINDVSKLTKKKIGIVKGYAYSELLRKRYPNMELVNVKNVHEGLQKVSKNELYGFADSLATIGYEIQRSFPGELKIAGKFEEKFELAIGTRNDEILLLSIFEKAIASLSPKEHQEILNHWISVNFNQAEDYTLIWQILGATLVIALILATIIGWQRRQHQLLSRAHKEVNQSLDSFVTLFNSTLEGIFISKDGIVIEANDAICTMVNHNKEDIIGKSPLYFVAENSKELTIKKMQESVNEPYEINIVNKNGTEIPILIRAQDALFKGDKVRLAAIINLTQQKEQQAELEAINKKLNIMATHDQLTGLANRYLFESQLQREIDRHHRHGHSLSLFILDIDFFKQVNDTHGHVVGDYVLKELSQIIKRSSRSEDLASRWGGEEFTVLLPHADLKEANVIAERLRVTIGSHIFKEVDHITVSIGVAQYCDEEGSNALLSHADTCLYKAKSQGRNQVVSNC